MALREDCFLVRRVAGRGIDKNISYSRAREDRFNRDRRFAAGGNEIGNRDPRDILKIKRLRQRVRDLETQQEIKQLRQRVLDLELQREMCKAETESNTVVWDEGIDGAQQSLSRHPQRFFEPFYPEGESGGGNKFVEDLTVIRRVLDGGTVAMGGRNFDSDLGYQITEPKSIDGPNFDEDKDEPDHEEYLWVQRAISGVTKREEVVRYETSSVSSGKFAYLSKEDKGFNGGIPVVAMGTSTTAISCLAMVTGEDAVAMGEAPVVYGGDTLTGDDESNLKIPTNKPQFTVSLKAFSLDKGSTTKNIGIQIGKDFKFGVILISMGKYALYKITDFMPPIDEDSTRGSHIVNKVMHVEKKINRKSVGLSEENVFLHGHIYNSNVGSTLVKFNHLSDHINSSPNIKTKDEEQEMEEPINPIDPREDDLGGLFEPFKLDVNKSRLDVPYDVGSFGPKVKLGDEEWYSWATGGVAEVITGGSYSKGGPTMNSDGYAMATGGFDLVVWSHALISESLNNVADNYEYLNSSQIQKVDEIVVAKSEDNNIVNREYFVNFIYAGGIQNKRKIEIGKFKGNFVGNKISIPCDNDDADDNYFPMHNLKFNVDKDFFEKCDHGGSRSGCESLTISNSFDSRGLYYGKESKSKVGLMESTGQPKEILIPSSPTLDVGCARVDHCLYRFYSKRPDVPFDPGGFGPVSRLEDESF